MNKTYFDKIGGKNKNLDIKRQMFFLLNDTFSPHFIYFKEFSKETPKNICSLNVC